MNKALELTSLVNLGSVLLALWLFGSVRSRNITPSSRVLSLFFLTFAFWAFFEYLAINASSQKRAELFYIVSVLGWSNICFLFYLFIRGIWKKNNEHFIKGFEWLGLIPCAYIFLLYVLKSEKLFELSFTGGGFIATNLPASDWIYIVDIIFIFASLLEIIRQHRRNKNEKEKKKLSLFSLFIVSSIVLGYMIIDIFFVHLTIFAPCVGILTAFSIFWYGERLGIFKNLRKIEIDFAQLKLLQESTKVLLEIEELDDLLLAIGKIAHKAVKALGVALLMFQDGKASVAVLAGFENPLIKQALKILGIETHKWEKVITEGSLWAKMIKEPKTIITDSIYSQSSMTISKELVQKVHSLIGLKKMVNTPLLIEGRCIGLMVVGFNREPSPLDIEFLEIFTDQASLALKKVSMIDEIKRANKKLDLMVKETTSELEKTRTHLEQVFENAQDILYILDWKGTIRDINNAIYSLLSYQKEEVLGKKFQDIVFEDDKSKVGILGGVLDWNSMTDKKMLEAELRLCTKEGGLKTFHFRSSITGFESGEPEIIGIARDITERKHMEEYLERYSTHLEREVEARTRELRNTHNRLLELAHLAGRAEISAGILHNIGNALNTVYIRIERIRELCNSVQIHKLFDAFSLFFKPEELRKILESPECLNKWKTYLELWQERVKKLKSQLEENNKEIQKRLDHISEIIALERSYACGKKLVEKFKVEDLINDVVSMYEDSLSKRDITLRVEFEKELPDVFQNKTQLFQVIGNLIKNSMEALEEKKEGERWIKISAFFLEESGMIEISVEDNGIGMDLEVQEKMFDFGFSTKHSKKGRGIGLSVSSNYLHSIGGWIKGFSEGRGKGALFKISFPIGSDSLSGLERRAA